MNITFPTEEEIEKAFTEYVKRQRTQISVGDSWRKAIKWLKSLQSDKQLFTKRDLKDAYDRRINILPYETCDGHFDSWFKEKFNQSPSKQLDEQVENKLSDMYDNPLRDCIKEKQEIAWEIQDLRNKLSKQLESRWSDTEVLEFTLRVSLYMAGGHPNKTLIQHLEEYKKSKE